MKNKLLLLGLFLHLGLSVGFSQQLTGRVYYQASNQIMIRIDSTEMSPEEITNAQEIMKKPWERDFVLTFSQTESNWRQVANLEKSAEQRSPGELTINLSGRDDQLLYKNLVEQYYLQEQEFMGKEFLIRDALQAGDWEMSKETKKIGEYTAQKATLLQVVDARRFSGEMAEMENVKDTLKIEVWYTPEIPIAHGPENYFGLPGLILEVHNGGRAFYCKKIELNPSEEPVKIEIPKQGKVLSSRDFDTMQQESIQQMENRYQGKPGEGGRKIRVGG